MGSYTRRTRRLGSCAAPWASRARAVSRLRNARSPLCSRSHRSFVALLLLVVLAFDFLIHARFISHSHRTHRRTFEASSRSCDLLVATRTSRRFQLSCRVRTLIYACLRGARIDRSAWVGSSDAAITRAARCADDDVDAMHRTIARAFGAMTSSIDADARAMAREDDGKDELNIGALIDDLKVRVDE